MPSIQTIVSVAQMIAAFLVAILLLVSLHELGHLVVARWCGIKVLRFSVGWGKPFVTERWRNIDWCLAPYPIGGYVKMVDTREGEVSDEDLPFAFDKQHPLKRIAVAVAGPLTNLILAVLLYWASFVIGGVTEWRPYVGEVQTASIAAKAGFQAGDKILSVNGKPMDNFADAQMEMVLDLEAGKVRVRVQTAQGQTVERVINAAGTEAAAAVAKRQKSLGIAPYKTGREIEAVMPNSAAAKAGLQPGDIIVAVDGVATPTWADWSVKVRENAGRSLKIDYLRQNQKLTTNMMPDSQELPDHSQIIGRAGLVAGLDKEWSAKVEHHYYPNLVDSLRLGAQKTAHYSWLTLSFFGKLVTGHASLSHISGPITIAEVAGQTVQIGWQPYINFLALVSISLGVMNLLPIPVLDGGHLLYYTIELLCGRPLSKRLQNMGLRFGVAVMLTMMILAFFNDITRLFG